MRKEFEMTEEDLSALMNASKPAPLIALQCGEPPSAQSIVNIAWEKLGKKMGFDYMTAEPVDSRHPRVFTAEATDGGAG